MRQHKYHFVSHWSIPAPAKVVAEALLHDEDWVLWWSGLEGVEVLDGAIGKGARFRCQWRSQAGYRLRTTLAITQYRKGEYIAFTSVGDLAGHGDFRLVAKGERTTVITINWRVKTTKIWMNLVAPLMRWFFACNHRKLMAAGERGLAGYVA